METTLFNVVYNRKKRLLLDGTALVQIEAYLSFKKKYFSTSIYLTPDQWDNKHRKVKKPPQRNEVEPANFRFYSKVARRGTRPLKRRQTLYPRHSHGISERTVYKFVY
jgi:hypothetical protein